MTFDDQDLREIEDALDQLRDALVNRDIGRADMIKAGILHFIELEGYTLIEDKKKIYVMVAKG